MKFKIAKPHKDEVYEITYDDKCLVIRNKDCTNKLWISKSMANWISHNFADNPPIEIKIIE